MSERLHRTSRFGHRVPAFIAAPVVSLAFGFLMVMAAIAVLAPRTSAADPGHLTKGPIPCTAVTHGTLAEVAASPGLIVVADVIALRQGDTPAVDQFAVKQIIRPEVLDQGLDLRAGVLTVPSNECWQGLRPGDRIIAIFPSPDTLVAERSVAWRVGPGDRVEQSSSQDVRGVPTSATALIQALKRVPAGLPPTSTDLPDPDHSSPAGMAGLVALGLLAFMGAAMWTLRRRAGVSRAT